MPVNSERPDLELFEGGLYDYLYGSLSPDDEDCIAIIDVADGSETTYAQLKFFVNSAAGWLAHKGISKGDVVGLHCPNSLAFIVATHAIWRLGAVMSPVSLLATPQSIGEQMQDSGAKLLLTVAALGESGIEGGKLGGLREDDIVTLDTAQGLQQMLAERRTPPQVTIDRDNDLAVLPYSSGTTGLPKGVKLTHLQLVSNLQQAADIELVKHDDVVFGVLPFFHIYGLTALANATLSARATLVTVPRFSLESFLEAHQKFKVTFTFIAPPIAVLLSKHPAVDNYDLSSLRAFFSGAATLDEELALAVEKRLGVHMQQGYGLTETSPLVFANLDKANNRGSVGRVAANTEYMIVDVESLEEIGAPTEGDGVIEQQVGELWVRGPQVMVGYLNKPEQTAATLTEDKWLRTGDLARQDATGNVFIVDRLKELIKYKGYQVPPAELEALLLGHPQVADVAVVGTVRDDGEEIPKAFVVLQPGETLTAEDIMDYTAARVAPYKKVRAVEFIDQIPKSATGKILRRELRAREAK
ncbi:AMP-binding protein [Corynebacterium auriscanis]|uniref:AMP-binding protein n=1 Tax=Corynebacterium auriscanis TaxID=99807 RepID=UPI003CE6A776